MARELYSLPIFAGLFLCLEQNGEIMAEPKKVNRIDNADPSRWMTTAFETTDEGFLTGRAVVTSVGVFTYRNADNSISRELRLPQEVFSMASLDSMKMKPLANDHPAEKITSDNAKVYQVGTLGNNPSTWISNYGTKYPDEMPRGDTDTDGFHVSIDMMITDKAAIADVAAGKTALSMGYICDLEPALPGATWCGIAYDGIQRNIRYNHCAIVDIARAGDAARIRMDSADAVQIYHQTGQSPKPNPEVAKMGLKKINLDGVDYEGDEVLLLKFNEHRNRADTAEKALEQSKADHAKALSTLEGERDAFKDRADKAEKEAKEAKDAAADHKKINEAVNAKLLLMDAAVMANVEIREDMTDIDIKKAVITAVHPNVKLDGKDEHYINVRFDIAEEELRNEEDSKADGESRKVLGSLPSSDSRGRNDSSAAYQRMVGRLTSKNNGDKAEG